MRCASGFTLLIVLIFLQVFALLTLNSLSRAVMLTKANFDQYESSHLLQLAQTMLVQLEQHVLRGCLVAPLPSANLGQLPLSWWQRHACRMILENKTFYYTLEWLGRDSCCFINPNTPGNITSVDFYRTSLFIAHRHTEILLQSTIALPGSDKPICKSVPHFIAPGRQMYREIK